MRLIKHIKVKVGEYQKDGQTKGKYETVGRVLQKDDGAEMVLLNRTFNPAGVPNQDNRDSIILNFWDAQEPSEQPQVQRQAVQHTQQIELDDEIPF